MNKKGLNNKELATILSLIKTANEEQLGVIKTTIMVEQLRR